MLNFISRFTKDFSYPYANLNRVASGRVYNEARFHGGDPGERFLEHFILDLGLGLVLFAIAAASTSHHHLYPNHNLE